MKIRSIINLTISVLVVFQGMFIWRAIYRLADISVYRVFPLSSSSKISPTCLYETGDISASRYIVCLGELSLIYSHINAPGEITVLANVFFSHVRMRVNNEK